MNASRARTVRDRHDHPIRTLRVIRREAPAEGRALWAGVSRRALLSAARPASSPRNPATFLAARGVSL